MRIQWRKLRESGDYLCANVGNFILKNRALYKQRKKWCKYSMDYLIIYFGIGFFFAFIIVGSEEYRDANPLVLLVGSLIIATFWVFPFVNGIVFKDGEK